MAVCYFDQGRKGTSALGDAEGAARFESAAGRQGMKRRDCAFDGLKWLVAFRLKVGYRMQKTSGVGMGGCMKDFMLGAEFNQVPGVHYGYAVSNL